MPAWLCGRNGCVMAWHDAPSHGGRQKGLKRGLAARERTVILMLDEAIITEIPPLFACYGRIGEQVCVPIMGTRAIAKRSCNPAYQGHNV